MRQGEALGSRRRPDVLSAGVVTLHVAVTYTPVYLAAASTPSLLWLLYWVAFGLLQNGLINLMHECAHHLTFRRKRANDILGAWLLAPLVLTDFFEYRKRHWDHHRHLGTSKDPKLVYHTPLSGWGLLALAGRCLVGLEALRRMTERPEEEPDQTGIPEPGAKRAGLSVKLFLVHGVFATSLIAVAWLAHRDWQSALLSAALAYTLVYGYGLGSLTIFAAALRAIAEHQITSPEEHRRGQAALRNLKCNAVTRLLFGAYGFGEHATHHEEPAVPYYTLPALTRSLAAEDSRLLAQQGYLGMILKCARSSATAPQAATARR